MKSSSQSSGVVVGAPRFADSSRMKQTFIAWPARRTVRLKCEASGSTPLKYQWLKDGLPAIVRRLQPRLKTNMWYLRLKDLVVLDSGKYTCVVSNSYGSINHTYTLQVVGEYEYDAWKMISNNWIIEKMEQFIYW